MTVTMHVCNYVCATDSMCLSLLVSRNYFPKVNKLKLFNEFIKEK